MPNSNYDSVTEPKYMLCPKCQRFCSQSPLDMLSHLQTIHHAEKREGSNMLRKVTWSALSLDHPALNIKEDPQPDPLPVMKPLEFQKISSSNSGIKIFVGNLKAQISQTAVHDAFKTFGKVTEVIKEKALYAFVFMSDAKQAEMAVSKLNGIQILGKKWNVQFSEKYSQSNSIENNGYQSSSIDRYQSPSIDGYQSSSIDRYQSPSIDGNSLNGNKERKSSFGKHCILHYNPGPTSKGFGFAIVQFEGGTKVSSIQSKSSAESAGLKINDIIIKVNDVNCIGLDKNTVTDHVKDCWLKLELLIVDVESYSHFKRSGIKIDYNMKDIKNFESARYSAPESKARLCFLKKNSSQNSYGVMLENIKVGTVVYEISSKSCAESAQLRLYDRIVEVNGENCERVMYSKILNMVQKFSDHVDLLVVDRVADLYLSSKGIAINKHMKEIQYCESKQSSPLKPTINTRYSQSGSASDQNNTENRRGNSMDGFNSSNKRKSFDDSHGGKKSNILSLFSVLSGNCNASNSESPSHRHIQNNGRMNSSYASNSKSTKFSNKSNGDMKSSIASMQKDTNISSYKSQSKRPDTQNNSGIPASRSQTTQPMSVIPNERKSYDPSKSTTVKKSTPIPQGFQEVSAAKYMSCLVCGCYQTQSPLEFKNHLSASHNIEGKEASKIIKEAYMALH